MMQDAGCRMQGRLFCLVLGFCLFWPPAGLGAESHFDPVYSVDDALALPGEDRLAVDLLWQRWQNLGIEARGKTALALSGGGARGLAHVGVLRHLLEIDFPIDAVVGTSIGAVVGGFYAAGVPLQEIEAMGHALGFQNFARIDKTRLVWLALSDGRASIEPFEKWLRRRLGSATFADTKLPFLTCAVDLISGELVFLHEGDLALALRAAATIPGVYAPAAWRQYYLVDGGLLFNIPTQAARLLNAQNVLLVDVSARNQSEVITRVPGAARALYRSLEIQANHFEAEKYEPGDYTLRILTKGFQIYELWRYKELWEIGIRAARENSNALKLAFVEKTVRQIGWEFFAPYRSVKGIAVEGGQGANHGISHEND